MEFIKIRSYCTMLVYFPKISDKMSFKRRCAFLLMGLLAIALRSNAQQSMIDSLKSALLNSKHDSSSSKILVELSDIYYFSKPDTIIPLCETALKIIDNKLPKTSGAEKNALLKIGASALNNIGASYKSKGDIQSALTYYQKALKIQEEIKDKDGIAQSLNNIGFIYENQGDIPKALDYYHRCLKIREELTNKKGMGISLNTIGNIYYRQGDYGLALDFYNKSLKMNEDIGYTYGTAIALTAIGNIYRHTGNLTSALKNFQKGLKLFEETQNLRAIAVSLENIGSIYKDQNDARSALEYYHRSLKIREEIKDKAGIANSLTNIAQAMLQQGLMGGALDFAKHSLQIAKELNYPESIRNAAMVLKRIYKKQNKFKDAFEMYELEIQMRDSINNAETKKASIRKQFQYQYEKKAAADSVRNAEEQKVKNAQLNAQQAQLRQERTQRFALYGGLLLVVTFSGFVFNRFKITKKQKTIIESQKGQVDKAYEKLHEKNKEVMDSIHYARRIQRSLLTTEKYIGKELARLRGKRYA